MQPASRQSLALLPANPAPATTRVSLGSVGDDTKYTEAAHVAVVQAAAGTSAHGPPLQVTVIAMGSSSCRLRSLPWKWNTSLHASFSGRISGRFHPAVAHRLLFSSLTATIA